MSSFLLTLSGYLYSNWVRVCTTSGFLSYYPPGFQDQGRALAHVGFASPALGLIFLMGLCAV